MIATIPEVQTAFLDSEMGIDDQVLSELCKKARNSIEIRCAGLVEISHEETWAPMFPDDNRK